jgi:hypothetical protein
MRFEPGGLLCQFDGLYKKSPIAQQLRYRPELHTMLRQSLATDESIRRNVLDGTSMRNSGGVNESRNGCDSSLEICALPGRLVSGRDRSAAC